VTVSRDPEWDDVLRSAARLQQLVPDAVLVGGTGAAAHAHHRVSFDHDHVLVDLRERFDDLLAALEATDGWITARVRRPVLILGSLDGVETGIRQLIRRRPLEVEQLDVPGRGRVRVPTLEEMLRVKAWLVLQRNATRDYLDVVALADRLDDPAAVLVRLDEYYADQQGAGGRRVATQLAKQLAEPAPYDLDAVDLTRYRKLDQRWRDWDAVRAASLQLAQGMLDAIAAEGSA
jgi:hypothetical protein